MWNDKEAFIELLNVFVVGMNENDHDDLKPFLSLIYYILQFAHKSEKSEQRFERTMKILMEAAESNRAFYKFMEAVYEFIFKL